MVLQISKVLPDNGGKIYSILLRKSFRRKQTKNEQQTSRFAALRTSSQRLLFMGSRK